MVGKYSIITAFLLTTHFCHAQPKWSLEECIDYALKNAISIKQAGIQAKLSAMTVSQNKSSLWPSLNVSGSSGYRFGLSENPTTGTLQADNFFSSGLNISTGVTLFNWFNKQHTLQASQWISEADKMGMKKEENDVVLNVSAAYLQALLAKELVATAMLQEKQTSTQLTATNKKISAGVLTALDASQVQLQLLTDSAALLSAKEIREKTLLQLKAVLNFDAALPFDIDTMEENKLLSESLLEVNPERLYSIAFQNLPEVNQIHYQIEAAHHTIKASKVARYPTFSLYGSAGSNFVNIPSAKTFTYIPQQPTGATVLVNGSSYEVVSPSYKIASYGVTPFFNQFSKNFGQNVGISIIVPIFNGKSSTTNWKKEELNLLQLKLQKDQLQQTLKTAVYTAYTEAVSALNKTKLNERKVLEATKVFDASLKRYNLNLLSTQDLLISRNNLERAKTDLLLGEYEFYFKIKLLEFYSNK